MGLCPETDLPGIVREARALAGPQRLALSAGALLAFIVLCANVGVLAWIGKNCKVLEDGTATLFEGSCETSEATTMWPELVINVLSTLLLGASNTCAQLITSPTRQDIDKAHAKGEWLDIGVPSVKNLKHMPRKRVFLWGLLCLSSVPLHLIYNSVIFKGQSGLHYQSALVTEEFLTGQRWDDRRLNDIGQKSQLENVQMSAMAGDLTRLEISECRSIYGRQVVQSKWRYVLLLTSASFNSSLITIGDAERKVTDSNGPGICGDRYVNSSCDFTEEVDGSTTWTVQLPFAQCASVVDQPCDLYSASANLVLLSVVISMNVIKLGCFIATIFARDHDSLETLGDAIASFLEHPDSTTVDIGPLSMELVEKRRESVERFLDGFAGSADNQIKLTVGASLVANVFVANSPQALISSIYYLYNKILTNMVLASEFGRFASVRKPLRVSLPHGQQYSTFWIQLPYWYSLPVLTVMGFLHWTVSRSVYVIYLSVNYIDGAEDESWEVKACGFSGYAMMISLCLGVILGLLLLALSLRQLDPGIPVAGSCSIAISAVTHLHKEELNASSLPLQYGVIAAAGVDELGRRRVGFSTGPVEVLVYDLSLLSATMATPTANNQTGRSTSSRETFSDAHWEILFSICDAVLPAIVVKGDFASTSPQNQLVISEDDFNNAYEDLKRQLKNPPDRDLVRTYLADVASKDTAFVERVKGTVGRMPPRVSNQLRLMLGALRRAEILQSWHKAWFFLWPMLGKTFTMMAKASWGQSNSLLEQACHYKSISENPGVKPGPAFDFNFLQFNAATSDPTTVETDVVIVGSGCGGAVSAKVLAEAGHRVVVVDRGYYFKPSECPVPAHDLHHIMQGGGALATVDGSTLLGAGQVWGGGGAINWSMSLQTSDIVREEWAAAGLEMFTKPAFQQSLDRVCSFMGVSDSHLKHNFSNKVLLEGSKQLGWKSAVCPQNTAGFEHKCGCACSFGCREGKKLGPDISWLPAAARSGAKFIEGYDVTRILFDNVDGTKKAVGVEGLWTARDDHGSAYSGEKRNQRRVCIQAKKIIIAGGALNTPLLLQKSGLKNPNIGQNLRLHPGMSFAAVFPEEVRAWEGEIGTVLVTEFEDLDGKGHGAKVIGLAMSPFLSMLQIPWQNGLQFKIDALKYPHMVGFLSLVRDRDSGSVSIEPSDGSPLVNYTPSKFDRASIIVGLVAASKISYIQGAVELAPVVPGLLPFKCQKPVADRKLTDAEFVSWLAQLETTSLPPTTSVFNSAHQMGTCRMSVSEDTGVVDESGKVWGVDDLYIVDTSVFPSASGANPMVTVMAISDHIARGIAMAL
ncbi:Long-chain-alcohol oxidase FAO2 [Paramyrothecium foliicola]|nr:Long-chain-alcohol oxidase FAO2 [Paramyrothecium foliicola]